MSPKSIPQLERRKPVSQFVNEFFRYFQHIDLTIFETYDETKKEKSIGCFVSKETNCNLTFPIELTHDNITLLFTHLHHAHAPHYESISEDFQGWYDLEKKKLLPSPDVPDHILTTEDFQELFQNTTTTSKSIMKSTKLDERQSQTIKHYGLINEFFIGLNTAVSSFAQESLDHDQLKQKLQSCVTDYIEKMINV